MPAKAEMKMAANSDESLRTAWLDATAKFAAECAQFREADTAERPVLEDIMIFLASELFDHRFSVTEIRSAFSESLRCLPGYSAGEDRRGDKY